jgi:hypothetical protein
MSQETHYFSATNPNQATMCGNIEHNLNHQPLPPGKPQYRARCRSGNVPHLYSGAAHFESRTRHRLSSLRFISVLWGKCKGSSSLGTPHKVTSKVVTIPIVKLQELQRSLRPFLDCNGEFGISERTDVAFSRSLQTTREASCLSRSARDQTSTLLF